MHIPKYGLMMEAAVEQAQIAFREGGLPMGAAIFSQHGALLGSGRNRRIQADNPTGSALIDALSDCSCNSAWDRAIAVSTSAPNQAEAACALHLGIVLFVIGDMEHYEGAQLFIESRQAKIVNLKNRICRDLSKSAQEHFPQAWWDETSGY